MTLRHAPHAPHTHHAFLVRLPRFVFILALLLAAGVVAASGRIVSISAGKANLREGPGTQYDVLYELGRHYPLEVLGRKGNWLKVRDFEGDVGWVYRKLTRRSPTLIVKRPAANLRSGPGTRYRILARLEYGEVMQALKRQGRWVRVHLLDRGQQGWIAYSLLWGG